MADVCFPGTQAPFQLSYFTSFTSAVLAIVITIGNLLIILAVMLDPLKQLRTPFAFFLSSVVISDLLVGILAMPVSANFHYREAKQLIDKPQIYILHLTYFVSASASLFSMAAMCFDRYYAFTSHLVRRRKINLRHFLVIVCIWVLAGGFSGFYFLTGYVTLLVIFLHVSLLSSFGITLVTFLKISRKMQKITKMIPIISREDRKRRKIISREGKVTRVFMSIMITFTCIYAPALVFIYILQFCISCGCNVRHVFRDLVFLLVSVGSAANPIVCIAKFAMIRKSILMIVKCKRSSRQDRNTSTSLSNSEQEEGKVLYHRKSISMTLKGKEKSTDMLTLNTSPLSSSNDKGGVKLLYYRPMESLGEDNKGKAIEELDVTNLNGINLLEERVITSYNMEHGEEFLNVK